MPRNHPPKDRFDDLPADHGRIGAHRAENPRIRGGLVLLWSAVATVVLVAVGVFGTMVATGRIELFPAPTPTPVVIPTAEPVVDTSFSVLVLNATPESGLAGQVRDEVIAAGWSADAVLGSEAGSDDFATTTVYYASAADEGAARGLAAVIGGAEVVLTDAYQPADDPDTTDVDESATKQLVIVIGLDRTAAGQATPAP